MRKEPRLELAAAAETVGADDREQTATAARQELDDDGVDVPAFLARVRQRVARQRKADHLS